ncbi:MAG TPA: choice-of-anchor tandem repeat GloVer-containing protein [Candidatus Limnocylindrales bacterium]|nr:choice-of-anchor tandem repeat GloVer-containing protein [Candidatus Limnocylindrales bacterium]
MKSVLPLAGLIFLAGIFRADAQTFAYASLHIFSVTSGSPPTNYDGTSPRGTLLLTSNVLYGMTDLGGVSNCGTIFKLNADGTGFTTLYNFTNGVDGANPGTGNLLISSSNWLFGVTGFGGTNTPRRGAVFRVNLDGTGFTNLYSFHGLDGQNPSAGLTISGNTLYGTTYGGGGVGKHGTVFKINTDGSGFTNLYAFSGADGASPTAPLLLSGDTLYGTTMHAGTNVAAGSVFRINTDGNAFTNLYSFTNGLDGSWPVGPLVLSNNVLFGGTTAGGISNIGTIFKVNTDSTGFAPIHQFTGQYDGGQQVGGLILFSNQLYGAAFVGFTNFGNIYRMNTDGSGFTNIYQFTGGSDGAGPEGTLLLSGNTFFETAVVGGSAYTTNGNGTVFALTFPVTLNLTQSAGNLTVSWPSPSTGFNLQTNGNLASGNWANYGTPTDDGTNKGVVISPSSGDLFFRLSHL